MLCEDAPQELRSRMWMALLEDPTLTGNLLEEKVPLLLPALPSKPHLLVQHHFPTRDECKMFEACNFIRPAARAKDARNRVLAGD